MPRAYTGPDYGAFVTNVTIAMLHRIEYAYKIMLQNGIGLLIRQVPAIGPGYEDNRVTFQFPSALNLCR